MTDQDVPLVSTIAVASPEGQLLRRLLPESGREALDEGLSLDYVRSLYPSLTRQAVDQDIFNLLLPAEQLTSAYFDLLKGSLWNASVDPKLHRLTTLFASCGRQSSTTTQKLAERIGPWAWRSIPLAQRGTKTKVPVSECGTLIDLVSVTAAYLTFGDLHLRPEAIAEMRVAAQHVSRMFDELGVLK